MSDLQEILLISVANSQCIILSNLLSLKILHEIKFGNFMGCKTAMTFEKIPHYNVSKIQKTENSEKPLAKKFKKSSFWDTKIVKFGFM